MLGIVFDKFGDGVTQLLQFVDETFGIGVIRNGHDEVNIFGKTLYRAERHGNAADNRKLFISPFKNVEY